MKGNFDEWRLKGVIAAAGIGILHCQPWSDQEILSFVSPTNIIWLLVRFSSFKGAEIRQRWKWVVVMHILSWEWWLTCLIYELKIKALRKVATMFLHFPYPLVPWSGDCQRPSRHFPLTGFWWFPCSLLLSSFGTLGCIRCGKTNAI